MINIFAKYGIISFRGQTVHFIGLKRVPQEGENRSAVHLATLLAFFAVSDSTYKLLKTVLLKTAQMQANLVNPQHNLRKLAKLARCGIRD